MSSEEKRLLHYLSCFSQANLSVYLSGIDGYQSFLFDKLIGLYLKETIVSITWKKARALMDFNSASNW